MLKKKIWELGMTVLLLTGVFWLARTGARLTGAGAGESRGVVLIDSGHGGSDPGKIGIHQEKEKDINLQIANRLKKQLEKNGVQVYMTRETDTDLSDGTGGNSKVQDLKRRCELVRELQPDCVLSIHQNNFTDGRYSGAQVFYAGTEGSAQLAKLLQEQLVSALNPGSNRKCKKSDGVYLMEHIDCTGVLVECGFLSNVEEEAKLSCGTYQKKLCCVIAATVSQYLSNT